MNESDSMSQSDTTSDFPSILKDKLELSNDIDFMDMPVSPTSKKTMAELMGLLSSPITHPDIDVEYSKNVLLLKLMSMQPGDLDEIAEERSEEIEPTVIDRTDCSLLLLRKNDSMGSVMLNKKWLNELRCESEAGLLRDKSCSTFSDKLSIPQGDINLLSVDLVETIEKFHDYEPENHFLVLRNMNNSNESLNDSGMFPKNKPGFEHRESTNRREELGYAHQMERFKKKRKPLEVDAAEKNPRLNELHFSNIRRVNLNVEYPINFTNSQLTQKLPDSGTNSTNLLVTETNSLNFETSQYESELYSLFSRSLLPPNEVHELSDRIDTALNRENKCSVEITKSAKLNKSKDIEETYIQVPEQLQSRARQHSMNDLKQEKISKSEKMLPLNLIGNFSLVAKTDKPEDKKSQKLNTSLALENSFVIGGEVNERNDLIKRLRSKLSARSTRAAHNLTHIAVSSKCKNVKERSVSFNENINSQNKHQLKYANPNTCSDRSLNNVNSKLKKFLLGNKVTTRNKVLPRRQPPTDINFTTDDRFFSTMKPRLEHIKATYKPQINKHKPKFFNSYNKSSNVGRSSTFLLNNSEIDKQPEHHALKSCVSSKEKASMLLSQSRIVDRRDDKLLKLKEVGTTVQDRCINDCIKRKKDELERQRNSKYTISRTLSTNSKIYSKPKDMLKRG